MPADDPISRLSRIDTLWTLVRDAHGGGPAAADARAVLVTRYGGAVHRYFRGAVRDDAAADDLFQEFVLRFLRGDFRAADPEKGRFRHFLKAVAYRMVADHHRGARRATARLAVEPVADVEPGADDPAFLEGWRAQLLDRTWAALREAEQRSDKPHHTVLRLRTDFPTVPSEDLAARAAARLGRPVSATAVRQMLHRAREAFADLLLDEVARSVPPADLADELAAVGLAGYCKAALARRLG